MSDVNRRSDNPSRDIIFHDPFIAPGRPQLAPVPNRLPYRGQQQERGKGKGPRLSRQEAKALAVAQVALDLERLMKRVE
ncbi:hypothetical protein J2X42_002591 [Arthrobacter sp. BE255]|nr:hypothetical protein [Arthrobacter sp. BE255]